MVGDDLRQSDMTGDEDQTLDNQGQDQSGTQSRIDPVRMKVFLASIDWPATKGRIVARAQADGQDDLAQKLQNSLPEQEFNDELEITEAIGE